MTHPTPKPTVPTSAEALRLAFDIVRTPCSAAESQRAEILLGIAREIREDQQYRFTRQALGLRPGSLSGAVAQALRTDAECTLANISPPVDREAWHAAMKAEGGIEGLADKAVTQKLPVIWGVGDKADCRHCHTPIQLADDGGTTLGIWRHKYTGQRACTTPVMAPNPTGDVKAQAHTFAEPAGRS